MFPLEFSHIQASGVRDLTSFKSQGQDGPLAPDVGAGLLGRGGIGKHGGPIRRRGPI